MQVIAEKEKHSLSFPPESSPLNPQKTYQKQVYLFVILFIFLVILSLLQKESSVSIKHKITGQSPNLPNQLYISHVVYESLLHQTFLELKYELLQ